MQYRIEIYDTWNRRIAVLDETPLLDVVRRQPDAQDTVFGMLPGDLEDISPNYRIKIYLNDQLFCNTTLHKVEPHWGENKKLILDRFVHFTELVEVEAKHAHYDPRKIAQSYINRGVRDIARDLINRAPGMLQYTIAHYAYPEGAQREYNKFNTRKSAENELEVGGISSGNWVGGMRLDATNAYAKDGKTIAGLEVDGAPWPDLRLQFFWAEETALNDAAKARHPETEDWSTAEYNASAYKLAADASKNTLQNLIDTNGIDFVELNPHRDSLSVFDGRVDAEGRYVGLVFGNGECLNAAMLEMDAAEVDLSPSGIPFAPELAPKDFFSYAGTHADSITVDNTNIAAFDAQGAVLESLLALTYFSPRSVMHVDAEQVLHLHDAVDNAQVVYFQPEDMGISWGNQLDSVVNAIHFQGNPMDGALDVQYENAESINEYGLRDAAFPFFSLSQQSDADRMLPNLLADIAYPEVLASLVFFNGDNRFDVGDLVEVRGAPLRRLSREVPGEWGDQYTGRMLGLVREVRHRLTGKRVQTEVLLTSPQRSVADPLHFMLRG